MEDWQKYNVAADNWVQLPHLNNKEISGLSTIVGKFCILLNERVIILLRP